MMGKSIEKRVNHEIFDKTFLIILVLSFFSFSFSDVYGQAPTPDSPIAVFNSISSLPKDFEPLAPLPKPGVVTLLVFSDPPPAEVWPKRLYTPFKDLIFRWKIKPKIQETEPLGHIQCRERQEHLDLLDLREDETAIDDGAQSSGFSPSSSQLPTAGQAIANQNLPWCDEVTVVDRFKKRMEDFGFARFPGSYKICVAPVGAACDSTRAHVATVTTYESIRGYTPPANFPRRYQGHKLRWGIVPCLDEAGERCVPFGGSNMWPFIWRLPSPILKGPNDPIKLLNLSPFEFKWGQLKNQTGLSNWKFKITQDLRDATKKKAILETNVTHHPVKVRPTGQIMPVHPSPIG